MRLFRTGRCAFTLLELQVAIVIIAVGLVAVASVLATESRMLKRLHGTGKPRPAPAPVVVVQAPAADPLLLEFVDAAEAEDAR